MICAFHLGLEAVLQIGRYCQPLSTCTSYCSREVVSLLYRAEAPVHSELSCAAQQSSYHSGGASTARVTHAAENRLQDWLPDAEFSMALDPNIYVANVTSLKH